MREGGREGVREGGREGWESVREQDCRHGSGKECSKVPCYTQPASQASE